jgi:hypothetical protein
MTYLKAFIAGFASTLVFPGACCGCCTYRLFAASTLEHDAGPRRSMHLQ